MNESTTKCFVLNCVNTDGLPFPVEENLRYLWLESLGIKDAVPDSNSFVCLDHFSPNDFVQEGTDEETSVPIHHLKKDAVPKLKQEHAEYNDSIGISEAELSKSYDSTEIPEEISNNFTNENDLQQMDAEDETPFEETTQDDIEKEVIQNGKRKICDVETISENVGMNRAKKKLVQCRLCSHMQNVSNCRDIFSDFEYSEGKFVKIAVAVTVCIRPLKISKNDKLSKMICKECLLMVKEYYNFRDFVLGMDEKQREIAEVCSDDNKQFTDSDFSDDELELICKSRKNLQVFDESNNKAIEHHIDSNYLQCIPEEKPPKSDVDKKFDKVEEELRRVLEGHLSEEQINAENIIISVENDEELQKANNDKLEKLSPIKLPLIINKTNENDISKSNNDPQILPKGEGVHIKSGQTDVYLPSEIKVSIPEKYTSKSGIFHVNYYRYLEYQFCIIDNYFFEMRLNKGLLRYLKCIVSGCPSTAIQRKKSKDKVSREATVETPHNHNQPDDLESKKHIFFFILKRKIRTDKTLNFKQVYEELIEQDPELKDLISMRTMLREICIHQEASKMPQINSFEKFYDLIEEDYFRKLHFAHDGRQFYQERFRVGDDRAIMFANLDVVQKESHSKIMYVDASFRIYNTGSFGFQLVTVLVWVGESYYPIIYVLVNRKTQDIYRKVFQHIYSSLAPNLRPTEIVTDYESNLYYALAETYMESNIGGSVFYYTQNLYKKVCTLGIVKDLEQNSSFKNIYHMLLMLPLLPVNTIADALKNIEIQANNCNISAFTKPLFQHIRSQWIETVTPELFCVHRLESRINENVIAPFKKLRDYLMTSRGKQNQQRCMVMTVIEKIIDLEHFIRVTYNSNQKKIFIKDLSSSQKKTILRAWNFIESHPKININNFFSMVLGYIKCMENQLWIWGFYRYDGGTEDDLINAANFSIMGDQEFEELQELVENANEEGIEHTKRPQGMETIITSQENVWYSEEQ